MRTLLLRTFNIGSLAILPFLLLNWVLAFVLFALSNSLTRDTLYGQKHILDDRSPPLTPVQCTFSIEHAGCFPFSFSSNVFNVLPYFHLHWPLLSSPFAFRCSFFPTLVSITALLGSNTITTPNGRQNLFSLKGPGFLDFHSRSLEQGVCGLI